MTDYPTKKVHYVGTSAVIIIDQVHVKRLNLDDSSFFVQKPVPNVLLEKRVLSVKQVYQNEGKGVKGLEACSEPSPIKSQSTGEGYIDCDFQ